MGIIDEIKSKFGRETPQQQSARLHSETNRLWREQTAERNETERLRRQAKLEGERAKLERARTARERAVYSRQKYAPKPKYNPAGDVFSSGDFIGGMSGGGDAIGGSYSGDGGIGAVYNSGSSKKGKKRGGFDDSPIW